MKKQHDELLREADTLLRRATEDALTKTTILLQMIADGTAEPTAAAVAAGDLTRLLDALRQVDGLQRALREPIVTGSRHVH